MTDEQVSDNITRPMQTQLTTKQDEFNILMLLSQTQTRGRRSRLTTGSS